MLKRLWLGGPGNATGLGAGAGKGQCRGVADVPAGADADAAIAAGCPDLMVPFDVKSFAAGHRATDFLRSLDAGPGEDYPIEYESGFEPWFICARWGGVGGGGSWGWLGLFARWHAWVSPVPV